MKVKNSRVHEAMLRSLQDALEELVERCDGESGVRADGSNIDTSAAHAVLSASHVEQPAIAPIDGVIGPLRDDQRQHATSLYLNLPYSWESAQAVINSVSADAYINGRKDAASSSSQAAKLYHGRTAAELKEICSTRPARYPEAYHEFDKTILALIAEVERLQARDAQIIERLKV